MAAVVTCFGATWALTRSSGVTLFELLFFVLALIAGVVTAVYAYSVWGIWGGVGGFVVGTLFFVGVMELIARVFSPKRPRCACGRCGVDDFVYQRDVDGQPIRAYACGRKYHLGDDRRLHPLTKDSKGGADSQPERQDGK